MSAIASSRSPIVLPADDIRRTDGFRQLRVREGLENWLDGFQGVWQRRSSKLKGWRALAMAAHQRMDALETETALQRRAALETVRLALRRTSGHKTFPAVEADTLARLGLVARDKLGLRPYPEQFIGVLGLIHGNLMEMATGEGKTLTLALAAVLAAWRGRPCHIVTANDYLAHRDARNLRRFYQEHQVSVEAVIGKMETAERRQHYQAAVVYTTAKELVADFLRDRLALGELYNGRRRNLVSWAAGARQGHSLSGRMVQRGYGTVFVDEADHILIDEAATPLIISRQKDNPLLRDAVIQAGELAERMTEDTHFSRLDQFRDVELLPPGEELIEAWAREESPKGILRQSVWRNEWVRQAIVARLFFERDRQYVVREGKVLLIDEGTGRQMPERSWRQGLHQAVEAKEGLELTASTEVLASISFQRFFRRIPHLGGVTGTAYENRTELWRVYRLPVFRVPTHRPVRRRYHPLAVSLDVSDKWIRVADWVEEHHASGQPVLIGTRSVAASQALARELEQRGLSFSLLNAVHHEHEAEVVAAAGETGRITIATNMAGRGTDIRLEPGAHELGGLLVIATERHEAGRIDRQLFGRCARQGEAGEVRSIVSLEDELYRRYLPRPLAAGLRRLLPSRLPGSTPLARLCGRLVQIRAERLLTRQRLKVLRQDRWLEESLSFGSQS